MLRYDFIMTNTVMRMDPIGCRCTDCLTGRSVPLDLASFSQVLSFERGEMIDAIGMSEFDYSEWADAQWPSSVSNGG